MKHQVKTKKLSRVKPHRESMLSNMANSLFTYRVIRTTEAKAKELRRYTDRLITTAKAGTTASQRLIFSELRDKRVVKKLFGEIIPQLADRQSGYTRVVKIGVRRGDGASISMVELLTPKPKAAEKEKAKDKKAKGAKTGK